VTDHSAVILVSVPNLREKDVTVMPLLRGWMAGGEIAELSPSFPCVTCPVQANMLTGTLPREHGVIANGFFWRERREVEMWTSPNDCIERPQLWQVLAASSPPRRSAIWFALHTKGCRADYVCTPAPIHNPDGTESLWCYTQPPELYGELKGRFGDFPLHQFWGPMASIGSSAWIVDSAVFAARRWRPDFFFIYLPHLDYAAQRRGPESPEAAAAVSQLDEVLARLAEGLDDAYPEKPLWLIAGEYVITPVERVSYPNRILREWGLLRTRFTEEGELIDFAASRAFALVDHQLAHIFVLDGEPETQKMVWAAFANQPEVAEVVTGETLGRYGLDHPRSGELVLIAQPDSWFAYYWWLDDGVAPRFARTVDIHRKPGYDPVELCFDPVSRSIPLDATLIRGSHGAPARDPSQRTVLLVSDPGLLPHKALRDVDLFSIVLGQLGIRG